MADAPPVIPPVTPPATPPAQTDWTSTLSEDAKAYVTTKGFKDPGAVLESYRNFEKLQGVPQDRLLRLPESMDTPEGRAIWERLGAPKEAKEYGLEVPKEGDPKLAEWAAGEFYKLGVPKAMAQNFIKAWNAKALENVKARTDAATAAATTAEANLRTEWGAAFDTNKNIVEQAATTLGLTKEQLQTIGAVLGPEAAPKLLLKLGAATQEHTFVGGSKPADGPLAPQAAEAKIRELMTNSDFTQRLMNGDLAAKLEWQRAHEMASQGMQSFT